MHLDSGNGFEHAVCWELQSVVNGAEELEMVLPQVLSTAFKITELHSSTNILVSHHNSCQNLLPCLFTVFASLFRRLGLSA